jgi:alkylation response protein AidB-like acyl-CoA dehydrogenase
MIAETARAFFAENATSARAPRGDGGNDGIDRELWSASAPNSACPASALPKRWAGPGWAWSNLPSSPKPRARRSQQLPMLGLAMVARALAAGGSDAQKAEWLPKLISGEAIAACEGMPSLDFDGATLTGVIDPVPHGAVADLFVFVSPQGAWIVRADAPGVAITAHTTMDQTRPFARVTLDKAAAEPLADAGAAIAAIHQGGWICLAAEALGGAQACLDRTVAYAKERIQFGRPIGSFQAYKHRLADMMIEIEQARSAVYWAACAADEGAEDAAMALHAAKSFCADTYFMCAGNMIQLHGGIGFTWEHDAHLFFKRARSIQTMLGNGNMHREQVATMVLGEAA